MQYEYIRKNAIKKCILDFFYDSFILINGQLTTSTFTAQILYSGIFATGSRAAMVSSLADAFGEMEVGKNHTRRDAIGDPGVGLYAASPRGNSYPFQFFSL